MSDDNTAQNTQNTQDNPQETQRGYQARLDALVSQREDANAKASALAQEKEQLNSRITLLEKTLLDQARGSQAPGPQTSSHESQPSSKSAPNPGDLASMVREEIGKALQPVTEELANNKKAQQLSSQQQRAFQVAVDQIPELSDGGSPLSKVAEEVFSKREDLRQLPDGPLVAAYIARGIVTDSKQQQKDTTARKRHAGIERTGSPAERVDLSGNRERDEASRVVRERNTDPDKPRSADPSDYADMFRAKLSDLAKEE